MTSKKFGHPDSSVIQTYRPHGRHKALGSVAASHESACGLGAYVYALSLDSSCPVFNDQQLYAPVPNSQTQLLEPPRSCGLGFSCYEISRYALTTFIRLSRKTYRNFNGECHEKKDCHVKLLDSWLRSMMTQHWTPVIATPSP